MDKQPEIWITARPRPERPDIEVDIRIDNPNEAVRLLLDNMLAQRWATLEEEASYCCEAVLPGPDVIGLMHGAKSLGSSVRGLFQEHEACTEPYNEKDSGLALRSMEKIPAMAGVADSCEVCGHTDARMGADCIT